MYTVQLFPLYCFALCITTDYSIIWTVLIPRNIDEILFLW